MKYNYRFFIMLFASFVLLSCDDNDSIHIESLSADGDEFFCNQKVKVWLCLNSSDLWHTDYKWTCDEGTLTQPQGLNEMTWKAPNVPGTYIITCKASIGGKSETRTREMYVSSYFFEKFEKSSYNLTLQSSNTNSLKKESNGNQYLSIRANISTAATRYVRRSFGDSQLRTPFSTRMKLGFVSNMPKTRQTVVGTSSSLSMLEYRWELSSDASNNGAFISRIRLLWYPCPVTDGYPTIDGVVEGTPDYNLQISVIHTSATGTTTTRNEYHNLNTMNTFSNGVYKNVSMGVDENERLKVYMEGEEILTSDIVKNLRLEKACEGIMRINYWDFYYLNGNGAMNIPEMYIDDAYASNTEMLK